VSIHGHCVTHGCPIDPENPFVHSSLSKLQQTPILQPNLPQETNHSVVHEIDELIAIDNTPEDLDVHAAVEQHAAPGCALYMSSTAHEIENSGQQAGADRKGRYVFAPGLAEAKSALFNIAELISPHRGKPGSYTCGHKEFQGSNYVLQRLLAMENHLRFYVTPRPVSRRLATVCAPQRLSWKDAARDAAIAGRHKPAWARKLCQWTCAYMADRNNIPFPSFGSWSHTMLKHGQLAQDLLEHLQSIGKCVKAQDVVDYLALPKTKQRHKYDQDISLRTAQRWMLLMNYRWRKQPNGQYEDGHERPDIVLHQQEKFLPKMAGWLMNMRYWKVGNELKEAQTPPIWPCGYKLRAQVKQVNGTFRTKKVVVWFQNKSTFYQNDRRHTYWVQDSAKSVPQPKGEGSSCMVSDFVSADYGWLRAPEGCGELAAARCHEGGEGRDEGANSGVGRCDLLSRGVRDWYR
jgi:hypothetical protein